MQHGDRMLYMARYGQIANGHFAQRVIEVDHECFSQCLPKRGAPFSLACKTAQDEDKMQRDDFKPSLTRIGHAPGCIQAAAPGLRHNRAKGSVLFCVDSPFALAKPTSVLSNAELSWPVAAKSGDGRMLDCKMCSAAIAEHEGLAPADFLGEC